MNNINKELYTHMTEADVPETLLPENIEGLLVKRPAKRFLNRTAIYGAALAGAAALVIVVAAVTNSLTYDPNDTILSTLPSDTAVYSTDEPSQSDLPATEDLPATVASSEQATSIDTNQPANTTATTPTVSTTAPAPVIPQEPVPEVAEVLGDYQQLYELIKNAEHLRYNYGLPTDDAAIGIANPMPPTVMPTAPAPGGDNDSPTTSSPEFSQTNNQIKDIDEGDIVKTDGKLIYVSLGNAVSVIKAENGEMTRLAVLEKSGYTPAEMQLYNDRLIIFWNKSTSGGDLLVETYLTSGAFDKPTASYSQKGSYISSRMQGSIVYLVTSYSLPYSNDFTHDDYDYYVPSYTVNGQKNYIPPNCIIVPDELQYTQYTVVSGLDISKTDMQISIKANLGRADVVYSSHENLYIAQRIYDFFTWDGNTDIVKFSLNKGNVEFAASCRIAGWVTNQFYMDEYKGNLRVVAEKSFELDTMLYALDKDLKLLSVVTGIGKGERCQSVRFDNEIAYIVTFWQIDPLFAFDMSDPKNPKKLDELKIPGFSRYMHMWSAGRLLGVGVDADEITGRRTGLKLSMFDVSNNEQLSERHVLAFGNANSTSITEKEHRAVLVSPEKNIIAVPYHYWSYASTNAYAVFSYHETAGFTLIGEIERTGKEYDFQRGLFIGEYIYIISNHKIISVKLSDFDEVREIGLR
ncbi:MAG: beta-propeller domain-containing protein [Oscillospiraceae bacterium]|nr:beta-propeller domain-containing protein [Oscillospiraceae bacterium]